MMRLPHPLILLLAGVLAAASLTWLLPAGEFDRREDAATGRNVVVAGTYTPVDAAPVGPFAAFVAVPRGIVEAADVIAVVLFVGGAWVVLDALGTLARLITALLARFRRGSLLAIPLVSLFFASMGALETMPVFVPLSDLLGISRLTTVMKYQIGAGLTDLLTPTNGALMAVLLAAGVPYGRWIRFALGGVLLVAIVGIIGMVIA